MTKKPVPYSPDYSILTIAHALVHGDRGRDYDHPAIDYGRTVAMFNAWRGDDTGPLTLNDGLMFMVLVKLSRFRASPHLRDHLIDAAGYLECLDMARDDDRKDGT